MAHYAKLRSLLRISGLPPADIDFLTDFFRRATEDDLAPLIKLIEQDFNWLYKINQNIKEKKMAFNKKDINLWQKIIAREEKESDKIKN